MAKPMRIAYSTIAMLTWVRAVIRMPTIAITSMPRITTVLMTMFGAVLEEEAEPKTARIDGPSSTVVPTVARMVPMIMIQPTMKPRYGLITRPTHSKDAPQLAFHAFRRR